MKKLTSNSNYFCFILFYFGFCFNFYQIDAKGREEILKIQLKKIPHTQVPLPLLPPFLPTSNPSFLPSPSPPSSFPLPFPLLSFFSPFLSLFITGWCPKISRPYRGVFGSRGGECVSWSFSCCFKEGLCMGVWVWVDVDVDVDVGVDVDVEVDVGVDVDVMRVCVCMFMSMSVWISMPLTQTLSPGH